MLSQIPLKAPLHLRTGHLINDFDIGVEEKDHAANHIQYESSITAQVGESNFSELDNVKYVKICLVVY
jgi:hypothetical protein